MNAHTQAEPRRRLSAEDRRAEIIVAATRLIADRGFRGVSLEAIAEECGITKAGLQHHFPSKDELLIAVLNHRDSDEFSYLLEGLSAISPEEFLAKARVNFGRIAAMPEIIRLFTVLGSEALDESHPAHSYFRDRLARARTEILASSMFGAAPIEEDVIDFMAYMDGLQLMWLRDPSIDFVEHAMRSLTRLVSCA